VTVDVVVRNRTGEPVLGLTQDDFEVFEDGVAQRIIGFAAVWDRPVAGARASVDGPTATLPLSVPATDTESAVALVFHQLSHQSRAAAVKAARATITTLGPGERAGIFVVDVRFTTLAPFTRNPRELQAALNAVVNKPPVVFGTSDRGIAETDGPAGVLSRADGQAAEIRRRLEAPFEGPQLAAAQSMSLMDLIALLARFPGRKSIMLFSEGLIVSPQLELVVDRARAENVTVYTINARGLEADRSMSLPGHDIDRTELTGTSRVDPHSEEHRFPELDRTLGLGPLARYTGGFLVADTNDLTRATAAVNADRRAFYVLAYASSNDALDDTVRQIEVRVKHPELSIRARRAYVATKPDNRPSYEQPLLQALAVTQRHHAFDFAARAYKTPTPGQPDLLSIFVTVPTQSLEFNRDYTAKRYKGEVAVLTQLKRGSSVVATQSKLYILTGDLPRLDNFRQRPITYFRTTAAPPGSYKLEAVIHDRIGNRFGVAEVEVTVPDTAETPVTAGDLMVVRRAALPKGNKADTNPLAWRGFFLSPDPSQVLPAHRREPLLLAIPLIVRSGFVTARLELARDGHALADLPVPLGGPEKDGRLVAVMELPVADLPAGIYEVTLKLHAAGLSTARSLAIVLR